MNKPKDGGGAFPWHQSPGNQNNLGMSLRDYFAGQYVASAWNSYGDDEELAKEAYELADAMITARERKP